MCSSKKSPSLGLPPSTETVEVKVIAPANIRCPLGSFIKDRILGHDFLECPTYVFLVEHKSGQKVLFDLGVRKDIQGFSPAVQNIIKDHTGFTVKDGVATILENDGGVKPKDINAIIWR